MPSPFLPLEAFARAHARPLPALSRGLCLCLSALLAREAVRLGLAERVAFVRWHLRGDPHFLEHWAVVLDDDRVLDLTAVQVDGDPQPLRRLDGYPRHFVGAHRYPVRLVLGVLDAAPLTADGHYPRGVIWRLHRRLAAHDARLARTHGTPRQVAQVARRLAGTATTLVLGAVLDRAVSRMSQLLMRLD